MHNVDAHYNVLLWKIITNVFLVNQVLLYTTQMILKNLWKMKWRIKIYLYPLKYIKITRKILIFNENWTLQWGVHQVSQSKKLMVMEFFLFVKLKDMPLLQNAGCNSLVPVY
jgi:hypothetical protein